MQKKYRFDKFSETLVEVNEIPILKFPINNDKDLSDVCNFVKSNMSIIYYDYDLKSNIKKQIVEYLKKKCEENNKNVPDCFFCSGVIATYGGKQYCMCRGGVECEKFETFLANVA
jgi:hypothetical protein